MPREGQGAAGEGEANFTMIAGSSASDKPLIGTRSPERDFGAPPARTETSVVDKPLHAIMPATQ
jgi:hypothetical protein